MVYLFRERKHILGFDIVLYNVPGALRFIASVPEKFGVNIEYIETCRKTDELYWLFLAMDFSNASADPELLLRLIRENKKFVFKADPAMTFDDIIFPSKLCIKDIGGMRTILMGMGNMRGIIKGIKEKMGEPMGSSFLYHLGHGVGRELYKIYAEPRKLNDIDKGISLIKALMRGGGWADIREVRKVDERMILLFDRLWECEIHVDEDNGTPSSHYIRGILAGFFEKLTGRSVKIKEVKCITVGDPYCEFKIIFI